MSRKYAKILFLTLLVLISFISFIEIIELLRRAGQKAPELSSMYVVILGITNIPTLVDKILPFAVLFGSMICFYLWGRSHEFLVGRTTGQNIWQALLPVIATVFAFGLFHITVFNPIAATTAKQYEYLMGEIFGNNRQSELSVSTNGIWMRDVEDGNNFIINGATLKKVEESLIRSPLIYKIQKDGQLDWRIKADEMRLVNSSWIISNAVRIQNDGQRVFLGDVMLPTALKPSDLAESKLPPKTVSIYKLSQLHCRSKTCWLASKSTFSVFSSVAINPFKLIWASHVSCMLYTFAFFTANENTSYCSWTWKWFCSLFSFRHCLPAWQHSKTTLCAGRLGSCIAYLSFQWLPACSR